MGGILSSEFAKQQEKQMEMQRIMLERQIHMQNLMRERMAAMQYGRLREMFYWQAAFCSLVVPGLIGEAWRTGNRRFIMPTLPIMFFMGYQADAVFFNKMATIRKMGENQLLENALFFDMPMGMISIDEIDQRREAVLHENAYSPHQAFL